MATIMRTVSYACDICGTRIAVTGDGSGHVSPIYCCGIAVSFETLKEKKKGETRKKTGPPSKKAMAVRKRTKKTTKKTGTVKKSTKKPVKK